MNPNQYLLESLDELKTQETTNIDTENIVDFIFKSLMSKKFRKYAAKPELVEHIKEAIKINVDKQDPLKFTFLHGAYKLWRLEEAPQADWAELFAAMYYAKWLKGICAVYKPGVWFDFFVDDLIVSKMDNIDLKDVDVYMSSFQKILDFLKQYQPSNMKMTITRVGDQFESPEAFQASLQKNIEKVAQTNPTFNERQLEMVELNAKPTPEELKDSEWREKIHLIHDTYLMTKREPGYHFRPQKILVFTQPLPSGIVLALGTTKTSVAKFWIGIGVLKKESNGYKQYILSPKQIENKEFIKEDVKIPGLDSKNFHTIKIFS